MHPGFPRVTTEASEKLFEGIVKLRSQLQSRPMTSPSPSDRGYRFPPEIISHAVWLYHRFCLSFRDVEDLLAPSGEEMGHLEQAKRKSQLEWHSLCWPN